ncbi:MAG TPA: Hsp20/alpha crystallin family protein [Candidatus Baltobacteraceae bacterium]|jgi:HSP20 family molecular chaperone IbpA|nr:Hsp20/alpha crystallin family protein [Candidatus Baltobacteraceae bacterium]
MNKKDSFVRHDEIVDEFDAWFIELAKRGRSGRFEPDADVYVSDDEREIIVDVEIAGTDPTELRVVMDGRYLFIVGRRHDRARNQRGSVLMKEIEFGDFVKKIHLPVAVAFRSATAAYCDGMLRIHLPISGEFLSGRTEPMIIKRVVM